MCIFSVFRKPQFSSQKYSYQEDSTFQTGSLGEKRRFIQLPVLFRSALADIANFMQEIETLYAREGNTVPTSCWFPFKRAYTRRPTQAAATGDALVLSVPCEIPQQDHAESQVVVDPSNGTDLNQDSGHSCSSVSDTYSNSIITEGDDLHYHTKSAVQTLAEINPNPLCKEFWVDVLMHGGSWNCSAPTLLAQAPDTQNSLSAGRTTGMQQPLTEISFAQANGSVRCNGLSERNLFQRAANDSSNGDEGQSTTYTGCSVRSRDYASHGCCTMKSTWHGWVGSIATCTDTSWADSETASTSQADSLSGTMRSFESKDKAVDTDNSRIRVVPSDKEVESSWTAMRNTGLLCAAMQWSKVKPPLSPIHSASFQKVPSAIKVCSQTPRSIDSSVKASNESPDVEMKAAGLGHDECAQNTNIDAPTPESTFSSWKLSTEQSRIKSEGSMPPVGCIPTAAMGSLSMAKATTALLPSAWSMPRKEPQDQDDPIHPQFYVEVEANKKSLRQIKDLSYIKAQEDRRPVDMARSSSLVDDNSAFVEDQCKGNVLSHLSPKRPSPLRTQSFPVPKKASNHDTAIVTPTRPNEKPMARLSNGVSNRTAVPPTPHRKAARMTIDETQSSPITRRRRIEPAVPRTIDSNIPSENMIPAELKPKNEDTTISRHGHSFLGDSIPLKETEKVPTKPLLPKLRDPVPSLTKEHGKVHDRIVPPKYLTVFHLKSRRPRRRESTTDEDHQSVVSELAQDFELARFPSLSSEDWQKTSMETNRGAMGMQRVSPHWWEG